MLAHAGGSLCMVGVLGPGLWPTQPPALSESLKTPEDCVAEQEILVQLLEVVNKRNVLIHIQEEKRLSELRA